MHLKGHRTYFYTFNDLSDQKEHLAIIFPSVRKSLYPIVRIHSECLTGDVFSSMHCDCKDQLDESIEVLAKEGGILLYMRQEGRGIGLYNKLDAYALQRKGLNTYEANQKLSFKDDLRTYESAAQMLKALGIKKIRLFSNNPDKENQLKQYGVDVAERIPTNTHVSEHNFSYLVTKIKFTKHTLVLNPEKEEATL